MPLLTDEMNAELLQLAYLHRECGECGHHTAKDYCRSCDEFYWIHRPGCAMYENHDGHRRVLVPFVEERA